MTPERRRDFETEWPKLACRLERMLARRGVPATARDDLVQETATRLFSTWEEVDRTRPAWPLTKVIVLNLMRDQARRKHEEVAWDLPEVPHTDCVETTSLARLELQRVGKALGGFTPQARAALLVDVVQPRNGCASAAEKMQRMRARKRLKVLLERAPIAVSLRLARLGELGEWLAGGRAALTNGLSCVACAAVGLAIALPGGGFPEVSRSASTPNGAAFSESVGVRPASAPLGAQQVSLTMRDAHELVLASHSPSQMPVVGGQEAKGGAKGSSGSSTGQGGGLVPSPPSAPLPTNGYGPEITAGSPNTDPGAPTPGEEVPPLPAPDPGEGTPVGVLSETRAVVMNKVEEAL